MLSGRHTLRSCVLNAKLKSLRIPGQGLLFSKSQVPR
jgi:hypothetical protein